MSLELTASIQYLKGVGPRAAELLKKCGISTIRDCFFYFPREYDDRRKLPLLSQLKDGDQVTVTGLCKSIKEKSIKKGIRMIEATIADHSDQIRIIWFNQIYLLKVIKPGVKVIVKGKVEKTLFHQESQLIVQETEIIHSEKELKESTGVIIPIYPLTAGLYQSQVRGIIRESFKSCLSQFKNIIPDYITSKYDLIKIQDALKELHFPTGVKSYQKARQRVVFDEFFIYQIRLEMQRMRHKKHSKSIKLNITNKLISLYKQQLSYTLTDAQNRVIEEIQEDLKQTVSMSRLLQGDVGSGKTDVAIVTLLAAIESNKSGVLMAPTEILATQHYLKLKKHLDQLNIPTCLLKSKMKKKDRDESIKIMKDTKPCIIIGTHALIEDSVEISKCGIVIIDEQHRFGVMQRIKLQKKGISPHCLFMTATPIPRSFMLTCFGDLDKSIIDEMPPGRIPSKTVTAKEEFLPQIYQSCVSRLNKEEQLYIIYPLVDESEKLDLKSAIEGFEKLKLIFPEYKVGLIHGKMSPDDKKVIMDEFKKNTINILVSTTVIEVGIDVPNASMMIIQHADRFGLSQLHQLRGRVGRGNKTSICYLISDSTTENAKKRLNAMVNTSDGFKIAEEDLAIRGPGDVLGTRQSGLPDFKCADLIRDEKILIHSKRIAKYILQNDPDLQDIRHKNIKNAVYNSRDGLIGTHLN